MKIIGGTASTSLAQKLAETVDGELVKTEHKTFPDGECYVRVLENLDGEDVVLVQTTHPDDKIIELFFWQDAIREYIIKRLIVVIPYLGYSRQDKKFEEGEAVSVRALAKRIEMGCDLLITVDAHSPHTSSYFQVPFEDVSGMPAIAEYLKEKDIELVLAPDAGAIHRAEMVASALGCPFDYLEKKRLDAYTVEVKAKSTDVDGKVALIVDDIISTGGTIAAAANHLKEQGAAKVVAACTHGLFVEDALDKLRKCDDVISTDTIENTTTRVSVAGEIAKALR